MPTKKQTEQTNTAVEAALLRKATGYTYTQQESHKLKTITYNDSGKKVHEEETVEVVDVQKYVPPEYSAIALWLKARMPQKWGDGADEIERPVVQIIDDIPHVTDTP